MIMYLVLFGPFHLLSLFLERFLIHHKDSFYTKHHISSSTILDMRLLHVTVTFFLTLLFADDRIDIFCASVIVVAITSR